MKSRSWTSILFLVSILLIMATVSVLPLRIAHTAGSRDYSLGYYSSSGLGTTNYVEFTYVNPGPNVITSVAGQFDVEAPWTRFFNNGRTGGFNKGLRWQTTVSGVPSGFSAAGANLQVNDSLANPATTWYIDATMDSLNLSIRNIPFTITGLSLATGDSITLRWDDTNGGSTQKNILASIDNFILNDTTSGGSTLLYSQDFDADGQAALDAVGVGQSPGYAPPAGWTIWANNANVPLLYVSDGSSSSWGGVFTGYYATGPLPPTPTPTNTSTPIDTDVPPTSTNTPTATSTSVNTPTPTATPTAIRTVEPGRIAVTQRTEPVSSQVFSYTLTGPFVNQQFTLTHDAPAYDSGDLAPASYMLKQEPSAGWLSASIECSDSVGPVQASKIDLAAGQAVTCTFTNEQSNPELLVTKSVGKDNDSCGTSQELTVESGDEVYFCVTLKNTGNVTLTEYALVDASLDLTATLAYTLAPGAEWAVINPVLESLGQPALLGPVAVNEEIVNRVAVKTRYEQSEPEFYSTARVVLSPTALENAPMPSPSLYLPNVRH